MAFTLTDKIKLHKYNKENGTSLGYQNVSSIYLGQYDYEDNNIVYLADGQFEAFSALSENFLTDINGYTYIIDAIGFYNIGKTACKIYMFTDDIDQFEAFSIMDYQISLQTTSLYNNSVRDWLSIYPLSYLDQFIDYNVIHNWPIPLPQPQPTINLYPVEIDLSDLEVDLILTVNRGSSHETKTKKYNIERILYDFSVQGINDWNQVIKNFNGFDFNLKNGVIKVDMQNEFNPIKNIVNQPINFTNYINLKNIDSGGINFINYKNNVEYYPNISSFLNIYRDGVKLKVKINNLIECNVSRTTTIWSYIYLPIVSKTTITIK